MKWLAASSGKALIWKSVTRDAWKRFKSESRMRRSETVPTDVTVGMLNDHFASVFQESGSSTLSSCDVTHLPDKLLVVTDFQTNFYLHHLKKGCGGPDGIPFWVFKNNSVFLSSVIGHFFYNCFKNGEFPSIFQFSALICFRLPQPVSFISNFLHDRKHGVRLKENLSH